MPTLKGNQRAKGNKGPPPSKYTQTWIEQEAWAFLEWMQLPESIFIKSFAIDRGYSPQRLTEFASKSPVFAEVLERAKHWQEAKLINCALFNKTNSGMTKFVLANHHGYTEKSQISGDGVNPLAFVLDKVDGKSKDLVDGQRSD